MIECIARTRVSAKPCWKNQIKEAGLMPQLAIFNIVIFHALGNLLSNNAEKLSIKASDYQ